MRILLLKVIFVKAVTPVKLIEMLPFLNIWPWPQAAEFLINGFQFSFLLPLYSRMGCLIVDNLPSVNKYKEAVSDKIDKDVIAGRAADPFLFPPFENFRISSLIIIPKKEPWSFR